MTKEFSLIKLQLPSILEDIILENCLTMRLNCKRCLVFKSRCELILLVRAISQLPSFARPEFFCSTRFSFQVPVSQFNFPLLKWYFSFANLAFNFPRHGGHVQLKFYVYSIYFTVGSQEVCLFKLTSVLDKTNGNERLKYRIKRTG